DPRDDAARLADVCALRQEGNKVRHAGEEASARGIVLEALRCGVGKIPRGNPPRRDDRVQMIGNPSQPLALTLGEPAGIGPELTLAVWRDRAKLGVPAFYVAGDPSFMERRAKLLGLDVPVALTSPASAASTFTHALPVVPLQVTTSAEPGQPDQSSAPAAIAS